MIAGAWLVLILAQVGGAAAMFHHHALIEDGPPLWAATLLFLGAWLVMVVAMMLPASLPTVRVIESAAVSSIRSRHVGVTFLVTFGLVWATFGVLAFLGDVVLHAIVDATPWLDARPWLIEAGVLVLAGGYQWMPLKRRSLAACRHPADPWLTEMRAEQGVLRAAIDHAVACLASSWALMLLMFAEGFANLWWMVGLTAVMVYETNGQHGPRAAQAAGVVLLLAALTVVIGSLA